jgi:polysaccharide export outer membrane protein
MTEQDVRRIGSTIILLLIAPGWGLAQTRQQPKIHPPSPSGGEPNTAATILVSPDQDYRIGPRDVIEVRVDDAPELSITTSVNADGTFLMPYLKRVKAAGKTSEELGKEIADGLRGRYLKDPNVLVAVREFNSRSFLILGAVKKPGLYLIEGKPSLLTLMALAGGPAENHGSTAFIIHKIRGDVSQVSSDEPEFDVRTVNINGMFKGIGLGDTKSHLEPGDIVNIPVVDVFFVSGEVIAPGSYPLSEGTTIKQALALSQGTTMNAALGNGVIFRTDAATGKLQEIHFDVNAVMKGQKEDILILANDIVTVPNSRAKTIGNSILKALGMGAAQRGVIYR